ncbi:hypothetical protein Tco_0781985 [Tanacetum coccineum]
MEAEWETTTTTMTSKEKSGETEQEYETTTADKRRKMEEEIKARGPLLMALPNKLQEVLPAQILRKNSFRPPVIEDWNSDMIVRKNINLIDQDKTVKPSTEKNNLSRSAREDREANNVNMQSRIDGRTCNIKQKYVISQTPRQTKRGRDTKIPQSSGPPKKVGDEAVHKELGDRMERAATTASSL